MIKKLIVLLLFVCPTKTVGQQVVEDILEKATATIQSNKSITYSAESFLKFFDKDDTTCLSGEVSILVDTEDTLFGGYVSYTRGDTMTKLYDGKAVYSIDSKNKKIKRFNAHAGEYWPITNDIYNNMVLYLFVEPARLYKKLPKDTRFTLLKDTSIADNDCYKIRMDLPDNGEFSEYYTILCISKRDMIPLQKFTQVKSQGSYEYKNTTIVAYKTGHLKKSDFNNGYPQNGYILDTFKKEDYALPEPLLNGVDAPPITGKHYQDSLKETTLNFSGNVTLLEFWYMSCPPCIEAIPVIEKFYNKYKDRGLHVYGINPVDMQRVDKLPKFLSYNVIDYPIFLVNTEVIKTYNIGGFPTFYLIGRDGKIVYSHTGFIANATEHELNREIEKALGK